MRILIVSQYFWPESFIINDLAHTLAQQGHVVKVLTGKPNYPEGAIFDGYHSEGVLEENFGSSIKVFRIPLRPRNKSGALNLIRNYLSFVVGGVRYFRRAVRGESYDFIFVFAPSPITSAIPAIYLKWRTKTHLAVWVQDLWPESLAATGFIKNRAALFAVSLMVRAIYKCTDTLLAQSQAFVSEIRRFASANKVIYYPNSYLEPVDQAGASLITADLRNTLDAHFCMVFAGNMGTAQALDTILEVAELLRSLPRIKLVIVGSGSMSHHVSEQKEKRGLDNLILPGRLPASAMPDLYKRAGGLLVTLKRSRIFGLTVPSKIQAYMAAGVPIVAALDGEGAAVVDQAKAGLTCGAEDAPALAGLIKQLSEMSPDDRMALGRAGRDYFEKHFEMVSQAHNLVTIMSKRISGESVQ